MKAVCKTNGGTAVAALSGELDHHGAAAVADKLKAAAEDLAVHTLVVDMAKVTFMDSSGIGLLLGRYRTMQQKKGKFLLKNPSEQIFKILRMAGMAKMVEKD